MSHLYLTGDILDDLIEDLTGAGIPLSTTTSDHAFAVLTVGPADPPDGLPTYALEDFETIKAFTAYLWRTYPDHLLIKEGPYVVVTSTERFQRWATYNARMLRLQGLRVWAGEHLDWDSPAYDAALLQAIEHAHALVVYYPLGAMSPRAQAAMRKAGEVDIYIEHKKGGTRSYDPAAASALADRLRPKEEAAPPIDEERSEGGAVGGPSEPGKHPAPPPEPVIPPRDVTTVGDIEADHGVVVIGENNRVVMMSAEKARQVTTQIRRFEAAFPQEVIVDETVMLRLAVMLPDIDSPFGQGTDVVASGGEAALIFEEGDQPGTYKNATLRVDINAPGFEPYTGDEFITVRHDAPLVEAEFPLIPTKPGDRAIFLTVLMDNTALTRIRLDTAVMPERRAGFQLRLRIAAFQLAIG